MAKITGRCVSILIIFILLSFQAGAENSAGKLRDGKVHIFFDQADSAYARQAAAIIHRSCEEMTVDLQIDSCESLYVYIAPSRRDFRNVLRGRLPHWTGAFATPANSSMTIRSPRWDKDNDFKATIIHELFHLLIHHKMKNTAIPRWMDEGLAIFYSGEQRWITSGALSKALATNSVIPLAQIDRVLKFHRAKAELAYQESYSAIQYLLATYDIDAVRIILDGLAAGQQLDSCFMNATGSPFNAFEKEWLNSAKKHYKWFWLADLDNYLWILIIVLFILVGLLVRLRNRKKMQEWQLEAEAEKDTDTGTETDSGADTDMKTETDSNVEQNTDTKEETDSEAEKNTELQ
ncbi:MAG TPA: peptidase MA family metallohydrolase [bacterium]|mgnify:CR=1 FL=1|nr:peptidase MA family metallohydrolase [bacterium]HPN44297.1 peptidase MA family metallohydrolase [bacterium]